jgi:hypothetical protein
MNPQVALACVVSFATPMNLLGDTCRNAFIWASRADRGFDRWRLTELGKSWKHSWATFFSCSQVVYHCIYPMSLNSWSI